MRLKIILSDRLSNDATRRYSGFPFLYPLAMSISRGFANAKSSDAMRERTFSTRFSSACPQRKSARVPSWRRRFTVRPTALWRTMAGATPSRPRMPDRLHALRAGSVPPTFLPRIRQRTRSPRIASNEKYSSNFTFISNRRRRRREAERNRDQRFDLAGERRHQQPPLL